MATARKKAKQRIAYVLPLANSPGGHRLGVNSLAVDSERSILYSAGRDGAICSWDIAVSAQHSSHASLASDGASTAPVGSQVPRSTFRRQEQAHTHWVNDIALVHSNSAIVSASSDITVKLWRPHAQDGAVPSTLGLHSDYVKCLASPSAHSDWVASGGLDHKIRIWDLNGGGQKLEIEVKEEEVSTKGSIYALSARNAIMASGGPESIVRVWDPRSGKRITKFVGHTGNVRDILINDAGDKIMTASSDQTVKVWSMVAGRCMHTLAMHNDSVWSLYSDHPGLSVFYSADRSGLFAKTDVRHCPSMDQGLSVAIAQEHGGVNKIVVANGCIWTATSSSSINRWRDVDTEAEIQQPESPRHTRVSSITSRVKFSAPNSPLAPPKPDGDARNSIPATCILKTSNAARLSVSRFKDLETATTKSAYSVRRQSEKFLDADQDDMITPFHTLPEETIEGQNGLIKHVMMNDRKRVLTLDTAGEVMLWDLIKCTPIRSYGKRHLEDVAPELNKQESMSNWCTVDTRTGTLAVVLEENHCFDAEMWADELPQDEQIGVKEDVRINLGKWILRYLFAGLLDEEIRRDETYRANLQTGRSTNGVQRPTALRLEQLPPNNLISRQANADDVSVTPRAANGYLPITPGLSIGVATPGIKPTSPLPTSQNPLPSMAEEETDLERRRSRRSGSSASVDYFTRAPIVPAALCSPAKATDGAAETNMGLPLSPSEPDKETKTGSRFGKKFLMNFPKKLGRSSSEATKPMAADDKSTESDKSEEKEEKVIEDNLYGVIQSIRHQYEEALRSNPNDALQSGIQPSLPADTPILKLPPHTTVIIQEDRPDSGGVADLYRGTVDSVGREADLLEKAAPMWLGELLLRNETPNQDPQKQKQPFILLPYKDLLPEIANPDGNARLNAPRMLRARKIVSYVVEKLEFRPQPDRADPGAAAAAAAAAAVGPEEYLELYCQGQLVPMTMTLATLRQYVWKQGGDIEIYYKSNGRNAEFDRAFEKHAEAARKGEEEAGAKA